MPKILTPDDHKRIKQEMIQELRELSKDGIAPSTSRKKSKRGHSLCVRSKRYWPTWGSFCKEAGVKPRNEAYKEQHKVTVPGWKKGDLYKALGYTDILGDEAYG